MTDAALDKLIAHANVLAHSLDQTVVSLAAEVRRLREELDRVNNNPNAAGDRLKGEAT